MLGYMITGMWTADLKLHRFSCLTEIKTDKQLPALTHHKDEVRS